MIKIVLAPVRVRTKRGQNPKRTVCIPRREYVRRTWYNLDKDYTCAGSRPTKGRTVSEANRVHPPEGACRKTWYNLHRDYTASSEAGVHRIKVRRKYTKIRRQPCCG